MAATRCRASVYRRDAYRRTGRGKGGFELHYTHGQCRRKAAAGERLCYQHLKMQRLYGEHYVSEPRWADDTWPPGKYAT